MKSVLDSLLTGKNIPVLTLDTRWHQLFSEEDKPGKIVKLESELNNFLKNQGNGNE
jgi:hypothetical protein